MPVPTRLASSRRECRPLAILIRAATRDPAAARNLFDALTAALPDEDGRRTGITVYDAKAARPVAWAGRVSDIPRERIDGPATLFVRPGLSGLA